jgi:hypothetical protein
MINRCVEQSFPNGLMMLMDPQGQVMKTHVAEWVERSIVHVYLSFV